MSTGVIPIESDVLVVETDIVFLRREYPLPEDLHELVYVHVEERPWALDGRTIVLDEKPQQYARKAITIHYRRKHD
jgi:hypothetical protein